MNWENRVVWSEGMLLQPQHFQQQARFVDGQIRNSAFFTNPQAWGMQSLEIDTTYLQTGKFCLNQASGILPDGTQFNFPDLDLKPIPLEIKEEHLSKTIYLALPIRQYGNTELSRQVDDQKTYRFAADEVEVRDVSGHSSLKQSLEVSGHKFLLLTELDNLSEFSCIPIAVVSNVGKDGMVSLKSDFIYPSLNIKKIDYVGRFLSELLNLAQHRVDSLVSRVSILGKSTTGEIVDFLMLQSLNRYMPLLRHLESSGFISPIDLYNQLGSVIGDLSTFTKDEKVPAVLPIYRHDNLAAVFPPIFDELRQMFSVVLEQNSINIPLIEKQFGIRVGVIADKTLFTSASFILAISADITSEEIRKYFPPQVKIGAVEQIKELVNVQLPGVQLNNLAAAPREIPYQRNVVYFELIPNGEYWQNLCKSGGIAIHIGTNFPNLAMELWAIRSNKR